MTEHEVREKAAMIVFDYVRIRAEEGMYSPKLAYYWDKQVACGYEIQNNGYPDNQNPYKIALDLLVDADLA